MTTIDITTKQKRNYKTFPKFAYLHDLISEKDDKFFENYFKENKDSFSEGWNYISNLHHDYFEYLLFLDDIICLAENEIDIFKGKDGKKFLKIVRKALNKADKHNIQKIFHFE